MTCVPWADFIKEKLLREDPPSPKKLLAHSRVGQWQFFSTTEMQDRMRILPNLLKCVRHAIHGGTVLQTNNYKRHLTKHEKNNGLSTGCHEITNICFCVKKNSTKQVRKIASRDARPRQDGCDLLYPLPLK